MSPISLRRVILAYSVPLQKVFPCRFWNTGRAGLPSVATEVGQCSDVLDHGEAGILVKPGAPGKLAQALISLLQSPGRRRVLAERFHRRVNDVYSSEKVADKVCNIYDTVLGRRSHESYFSG